MKGDRAQGVAGPSAPLLSLEQVSVRFGGIEALRQVNLSVRPGQVVAIIGPNGAGKSTLFNVIGGQLRPSAGHMAWQGERLPSRPARRLFRCMAALLLALAATLAGQNLDRLWRLVVVEPHRVEQLAAVRAEPIRPVPTSRLVLLFRILGDEPVVAADRRGWQVAWQRPKEASGPGVRYATWAEAEADRSAGAASMAPLAHRRRLTLAGETLGLALALAAWLEQRARRATGEPHAHAQRGLARTFQNIRLFDGMTVRDNVLVAAEAARARDASTEPLGPAVDAVLERLELTANAGQLAADISYGDRRRLEIARALVQRPRLLLLDEPAAGMHAGETSRVLALVRALRAEGMAVLLIEHDMRLVMDVSDEVVVLDNGEVIAQGVPEAVRADPRVIKAYLGEPADVEAPGQPLPAFSDAGKQPRSAGALGGPLC